MIQKLPAFAAVVAAALLFSSPALAKTNLIQHTASARPQAPGPDPGTFEAKIEGFMRQAGYDFSRVKANSWYIILPGKEMPQIRIILGAGPGTIAIGAVAVPKRDLRLSSDALVKLMKLSYDLNYVRVCLDPDEDLLVMAQRKDPWLTLEEFKNTVSRVSSAADRAYAEMRPYLTQP